MALDDVEGLAPTIQQPTKIVEHGHRAAQNTTINNRSSPGANRNNNLMVEQEACFNKTKLPFPEMYAQERRMTQRFNQSLIIEGGRVKISFS